MLKFYITVRIFCGNNILYMEAEKIMFENLKLKIARMKLKEKKVYGRQIEKCIEEMEELKYELDYFLKVYGWQSNNLENYKNYVGNIQKEIQDVLNTVRQMEHYFNQTGLQKRWTLTCKQKILRQMRKVR